ncbi:uncharacterized protein LOC113243093 isoform X2 [Ursus arctos]|uniref:uncharacterized protein LOC113243093 isoform X2 n=1 Tax=Ursus arctos TaxID=9644 RepID=UPI002549493A|nr:uncharacterized protein LOC113243093 isoform X2 [Ursus arctos]
MSPLSLVPFLPRQEVTPIFSSHGGLRSRRLWGCLGCFSSVPSGAQERSGAPLPSGPPRRAPAPPTLGGPISGPSRARHNGSLAASPPEPAPEGPPAALHASFQPCPLGEGAQRDDRGAGCKERERGDSEPEPQKIAPKLV